MKRTIHVARKETQIVNALNLIKQPYPRELSKEIKGKHQDLLANFGFLNHNSAI